MGSTHKDGDAKFTEVQKDIITIYHTGWDTVLLRYKRSGLLKLRWSLICTTGRSRRPIGTTYENAYTRFTERYKKILLISYNTRAN